MRRSGMLEIDTRARRLMGTEGVNNPLRPVSSRPVSSQWGCGRGLKGLQATARERRNVFASLMEAVKTHIFSEGVVPKRVPGSFSGRMKLNLEPFESAMHGALRYLPLFGANQVESMKRTVVGLITPHVLTIADLAKRAETGANVDWHVRDAVAKTIDDLGLQYNARDLLSAYIQWLETAAREAGQARQVYASVLHAAAAAAARHLQERD